jgi:hypothetical protein
MTFAFSIDIHVRSLVLSVWIAHSNHGCSIETKFIFKGYSSINGNSSLVDENNYYSQEYDVHSLIHTETWVLHGHVFLSIVQIQSFSIFHLFRHMHNEYCSVSTLTFLSNISLMIGKSCFLAIRFSLLNSIEWWTQI